MKIQHMVRHMVRKVREWYASTVLESVRDELGRNLPSCSMPLPDKEYSLFPGRFQPFHMGHAAVVDKLLGEGRNVAIAVIDKPLGANNPSTASQRVDYIRRLYRNDPNVYVFTIPNMVQVAYGRKVGYDIREIRLDANIEKISSTNIRKVSKALKNHIPI